MSTIKKTFFLLFIIISYKSIAQADLDINSQSRQATLIGENTFDLGKIPQNLKTDLDFEITNTGSVPIEIQEIISGCNCSTSSKKLHLDPGESSLMKIKYDTGNKKGSQIERVAILLKDAPFKKIFYLKNEIIHVPEADHELEEINKPSSISNESDFNIELFPNPASDFINVNIDVNGIDVFTIDLVNTLGQKMYTKNILKSKTITISVDDFPGGMYYLILMNSKGEVLKKPVSIIGK